jgi:hypothetical protein
VFRWLYQYQVISREAFLAWEEDEEDGTPGRAEALSQVTDFLNYVRAQH